MKKRKKIAPLVPRDTFIPIIIALVWNMLVYNGTKIIMRNSYHYKIGFEFEEAIPFLPWTVTIYLGCYIFWVVNYIIGCRQDRKEAFQFISADFFAKTICLLFFLLFPTTNIRPEVADANVFDWFMQLVYRMDTPENLFPSIHCLTSWFCFIVVRKNKAIPKWYRVLSLIFTFLICISTLTTKQHVLIDVFAGLLLAEGSYFLVRVTGFATAYEKISTKCGDKIYRLIKKET